MKQDKKIPIYYAWFIIFALSTQILNIKSQGIDSIVKLGVIIVLIIKIVQANYIKYVDFNALIYIMILLFSELLIIVMGNDGIITVVQDFVIVCLLIYLLYTRPRNTLHISETDIYKFYKIYVYFILVSCIYNMIIHFNSLRHITSLTIYGAEDICSFFDNKNTYGVFLLFGVLAATILWINTKEYRWGIFLGIFVINELMAMCRTAIIISLILTIIAMLVDDKHKLRNAFCIIICIGVFLIILKRNETFHMYIFNSLFGNTSSMDSRNDYINRLLPYATGKHLWCGYGNTGATQLAINVMGNRYYHNTYLKLLMEGGVIRILLQVEMLLLSLYYGIQVYRVKKGEGALCLLSTTVYVVYSCVESVVLFDTPVVAMMATIFVISMPILFYNALMKNEDEEDE